MIKTILWDIDGTILDFLASQAVSLRACFRHFGLGELSDEALELYSSINQSHWEALEREECSKAEVLENRFVDFFKAMNITSVKPQTLNEMYEAGLPDTIVFVENAFELLKGLKGNYKQYAVTNGAEHIQKAKLERSGLNEILDGAFISDEIGFEKPNLKFFEAVFESIEKCNRDEILIVGDSLTSDMRGGCNAGIKTCWYNPSRKHNNGSIRVDYEIEKLSDVLKILNGAEA